MKTTTTKGIARAEGRKALPLKAAKKGGKPRKKSTRAYRKSPELNWLDRLVRSLNQIASKDWVPPPYQSLLSAHRKKASITLH